MNRSRIIILLLALLGGVLLFVFLDSPPALPAVEILPPTPLAVKSGRVPDRWIPAKWTWLRWACRRILGPPRTVSIDIRFRCINGTVKSIIAQHHLGQPLGEGNGVAAWIVPVPALPQFKIDCPILTDNLTEAKLTPTFPTFTGYSGEVFPRLQEKAIVLSTRLFASSGIQTNFIAAVRAQIPYGKALFLLDVRQPDSVTNRTAIWITADEIDAQGNKLHSLLAPSK